MPDVAITPGSGANVATHTITRDSVTEHVALVSFATTASIVSSQTTVSTTAVQISSGSPGSSRRWVMVANNGNDAAYLGPSGVTTSTGFPLQPGTNLMLPLGSELALYAIAATGTTVAVLELS